MDPVARMAKLELLTTARGVRSSRRPVDKNTRSCSANPQLAIANHVSHIRSRARKTLGAGQVATATPAGNRQLAPTLMKRTHVAKRGVIATEINRSSGNSKTLHPFSLRSSAERVRRFRRHATGFPKKTHPHFDIVGSGISRRAAQRPERHSTKNRQSLLSIRSTILAKRCFSGANLTRNFHRDTRFKL